MLVLKILIPDKLKYFIYSINQKHKLSDRLLPTIRQSFYEKTYQQ